VPHRTSAHEHAPGEIASLSKVKWSLGASLVGCNVSFEEHTAAMPCLIYGGQPRISPYNDVGASRQYMTKHTSRNFDSCDKAKQSSSVQGGA
jgi:hypothetical protein